MNLRAFLAILLCKFLRAVSRLLHRGGTAMPGRVALKLCPELLGLGISRLNGQVITRVEPMLARIVEAATSVNAFSRHYTLDA